MAVSKTEFRTYQLQEVETLYEQSFRQLRSELNKGQTYSQACAKLSDIDQKLKEEIANDFLRSIVAERHFGKGQKIEDIALLLGVTYNIVQDTCNMMLKEIGHELARKRLHYQHNTLTH
ncbi:MAG: hypothetical protein KKB30_11015 [Proteobacteria bacterium]|nr:hypothetical protein [Pseudomonadota bacterium]MBU1714560.1 hypothetical protein [Pseudomonadota bacterium]